MISVMMIRKTTNSPAGALLLCLPLLLLAPPSAVGSSFDESFNTLQQWVQTERIISEERTQWEIERATLEDLLGIHQQELELLAERIERAEEALTEADENRARLVDEQEELREIQQAVIRRVEQEEQQLLELVRYFPRPLQSDLRPHTNRLPRAGEPTRLTLSQRMQSIVVILSQSDTFNNNVHVVSETREFPDGIIAVDTLYFGLGIAYYVDGAGEHAGVGYPARDGWRWVQDEDLALPITRALRAYRRNDPPSYIALPVELTDIRQ